MGTAKARGQNEQRWRETKAEGGSTEFQTIVFQKQNESDLRNSTACKADIRLRMCPPPPPSSPTLCSLALASFPTHGGPRHSQKQLAQIQTHQTHTQTRALGAQTRPVEYLEQKRQGIPLPLLPRVPVRTYFICLGYMALGVSLSASFHCNKTGLETIRRTLKTQTTLKIQRTRSRRS